MRILLVGDDTESTALRRAALECLYPDAEIVTRSSKELQSIEGPQITGVWFDELAPVKTEGRKL